MQARGMDDVNNLDKDVAACLTFLIANRSSWEIAEDGEERESGELTDTGAIFLKINGSNMRRLRRG